MRIVQSLVLREGCGAEIEWRALTVLVFYWSNDCILVFAMLVLGSFKFGKDWVYYRFTNSCCCGNALKFYKCWLKWDSKAAEMRANCKRSHRLILWIAFFWINKSSVDSETWIASVGSTSGYWRFRWTGPDGFLHQSSVGRFVARIPIKIL